MKTHPKEICSGNRKMKYLEIKECQSLPFVVTLGSHGNLLHCPSTLTVVVQVSVVAMIRFLPCCCIPCILTLSTLCCCCGGGGCFLGIGEPARIVWTGADELPSEKTEEHASEVVYRGHRMNALPSVDSTMEQPAEGQDEDVQISRHTLMAKDVQGATPTVPPILTTIHQSCGSNSVRDIGAVTPPLSSRAGKAGPMAMGTNDARHSLLDFHDETSLNPILQVAGQDQDIIATPPSPSEEGESSSSLTDDGTDGDADHRCPPLLQENPQSGVASVSILHPVSRVDVLPRRYLDIPSSQKGAGVDDASSMTSVCEILRTIPFCNPA